MTRRHRVALALALLAALGVASADDEKKDEKKGKAMETLEPFPFGLKKEDLAKVEVVYSCVPSKTGAGRQEIKITGEGKVRLLRETRRDDPSPETKDGEVPQAVVVRLLDFMEEQRFTALKGLLRDDEQEATGGAWTIVLTLPAGPKKVVATDLKVLEFQRCGAAIKLAASLALPDALQKRFFKML